MSASNTTETNLLLLLFNNSNWANLGDATGVRGSTTAGSLYISLHTADPGEAGNQSTSEATATGYARQPVARSSAGFTVLLPAQLRSLSALPRTFRLFRKTRPALMRLRLRTLKAPGC
jgi:hypothetical protein